MNKCQEEGCQETDNLIECRLTIYKGDWGISPVHIFMQYGISAMWEYVRKGWTDTYEYYCAEHCQKNGYCYGCGEFWAGSESFDFSKSGLCSNCQGEFENDFYYDEDDYDMSSDYYLYDQQEYYPDEEVGDDE